MFSGPSQRLRSRFSERRVILERDSEVFLALCLTPAILVSYYNNNNCRTVNLSFFKKHGYRI